MPAKNGFKSLPFIVSTDRKDVDTETRKFIRSHVMLGKNRIKPRKKARAVQHEDSLTKSNLLVASVAPTPSMTRSLCSMFSSVRFADDVEPTLVADVLSFSAISSEAMFMLNEAILPEAAAMMEAWFAPMLFDAAYLNAVCFTIQAYYDAVLVRTRTDEARRRDRMYYAKAVRHLQERLAHDDDSIRLSNSTAMTVLLLYGHAYTSGDYETAENHGQGLLKLVKMRGVDSFLGSTRLSIEIIRCDLAMAIDSCSKPTLFDRDSIPWPLTPNISLKAIRDLQIVSKQSNNDRIMPYGTLDPALAAIWIAMSHFCSQINAAADEHGPKISEKAFLHRMGSVIYRLLHQRYTAGSLDEAFRLALLAFAAPIFLHWNRDEPHDRRFTAAVQDSLNELRESSPDVDARDLLWLSMIGALTMFQETDSMLQIKTWLQEYAEMCDVLTWDDLRDLLCSFLWIGSVYDYRGKLLFESILP